MAEQSRVVTGAPSDLTDLWDAVTFPFWLVLGVVVLGMVAAMLAVASPLIGAIWLAGVIRQRDRRTT